MQYFFVKGEWTNMSNKLYTPVYFIGADMKQINDIVKEIKGIMQFAGISVNSIVTSLNGKCSRQTILNFFGGDADCKLSTLLMILRAVGADIRIDTDMSKEAIISDDIAAYRAEVEQLRAALEQSNTESGELRKARDFLQTRYEELIDKNTALTKAVEKQQTQIEKYMERMERAENALYAANEDARRKDAKISELLSKGGQW